MCKIKGARKGLAFVLFCVLIVSKYCRLTVIDFLEDKNLIQNSTFQEHVVFSLSGRVLPA